MQSIDLTTYYLISLKVAVQSNSQHNCLVNLNPLVGCALLPHCNLLCHLTAVKVFDMQEQEKLLQTMQMRQWQPCNVGFVSTSQCLLPREAGKRQYAVWLRMLPQAKQAISAAALLPAGLPTHLAASVCSGFVSAVISTPADVIKTRLMAQAVEGPGPQQRSQERPSAAAAGSATPGAFKTTSTRRYSSPARQGLCAESARAGAAARPAVQAGAHQAVQLAVQHAAWPASSSVKGAAVTPGALAPPRAVLHVVRSSMSSQHGGSGPFRHSTPQHYTGMVDCAVQIVKQEGLLALYQG